MSRVAESERDEPRQRARARLDQLTEREQQIAHSVGDGQSNAEISRAHYLSLPTVKTHISRILTKLDLNNRVQIALLVHDAASDQD
jgi:DNA-binding NarL/FixJ family response regulator